MERADLLERLQSGRREWDDLISSVPRERMLEPVWEGGWTIKDIVAHVDFYEWWVAEFIRTRDWPVVDPSLQIAELEPRNIAIYTQFRYLASITASVELSVRRETVQ